MTPKINVNLPDDLAAEVKAAGVPVSAICQQALADAVAAERGRRPVRRRRQDDLENSFTKRAWGMVADARVARLGGADHGRAGRRVGRVRRARPRGARVGRHRPGGLRRRAPGPPDQGRRRGLARRRPRPLAASARLGLSWGYEPQDQRVPARRPGRRGQGGRRPGLRHLPAGTGRCRRPERERGVPVGGRGPRAELHQRAWGMVADARSRASGEATTVELVAALAESAG